MWISTAADVVFITISSTIHHNLIFCAVISAAGLASGTVMISSRIFNPKVDMKIGSLLFAGAVSLCCSGKAIALEPTTVNYSSNANWSNPTSNEFDGSVVHDRHEVDGYQIVSSWSKRGIRLTLTKTFSKIEGYKAVETCKDTEKGERRCEFKNEPVQKQVTEKYRAAEVLISINNKLYKYSQGAVSRGLAKALANAPLNKNARIRISLVDSIVESEIGTGTVRAWRKIYK